MTKSQILEVYHAIAMMEGALISLLSKDAMDRFTDFGYWDLISSAQIILKDELEKTKQ